MKTKKSAAVSARPKAAGKSGGSKRPGRGKKKQLPRPGLYPALVLAFLAGIALMGALWLWRDAPDQPAPVKRAPVTASVPAGRPSPPAAASAPAPSGDAAANATIMRALVDMANLPYEESLSAPLEENVRQVDYALVQAMLRLSMRPAETVIEKTELRHSRGGRPDGVGGVGGAYHFQRLRIVVGPDPLPFVTALHESLRAWAEKAELAQVSSNRQDQIVWTVSVSGVQTHELVLLLARPGTAPVAPMTPPDLGLRRVLRQRQPGEPARLVLVMDDLGQSMPAVRQLLALPYPVTFAIWPDSSHAREAGLAAHAAGREIIVHQPMEPLGYPKVKPGPGALLVGADEAAIEEQVRSALNKVPYAVGMNNHMGSRFTQNSAGVRAVLRVLRAKKLMALDSMTHPASVLHAEAARQGFAPLKRDVFLDVTAKKEAVLHQLRTAEKVALLTGHAIAIGHPLPETLAALKEWSRVRNPQVTMVRLADLAKETN